MLLDLRVARGLADERQARERELAALRLRPLDPTRTWRDPARAVRVRVGRALIRAGRRLAADAQTTPAWSA